MDAHTARAARDPAEPLTTGRNDSSDRADADSPAGDVRPEAARIIRLAMRIAVDLLGSGAQTGDALELTFDVTRNGKAVSLQDYLGAKGHLVALRDGDLAFLHVHPNASSLRFEAACPNVGRYRLFLQFRVAGQVHTAAFTLEVDR